jgi:hypothetical protein
VSVTATHVLNTHLDLIERYRHPDPDLTKANLIFGLPDGLVPTSWPARQHARGSSASRRRSLACLTRWPGNIHSYLAVNTLDTYRSRAVQ